MTATKKTTRKTVTRKKTTRKKKETAAQKAIRVNREFEKRHSLSLVASRSELAGRLGISYGGTRDLYTNLGWKKELQFEDYYARYIRQDIAAAIIDRPVDTCWQKHPRLTESETEETAFEKDFGELEDEVKLFSYFDRVDRLATIGQYAVIFLGLDDGAPPEEPVESATKLMYVAVYSEGNATIDSVERDPKNPRFNQPTMYGLTRPQAHGDVDGDTEAMQVHHSRIIHVVEGALEDDTRGLPRLERVFNLLQGMEVVVGSAPEIWWRNAFPGLAFGLDPDFNAAGGMDLEDMEDEIEKYLHDFQRYLRLQGIKVDQLAPNVADPRPTFEIMVDILAAAVAMPQRIMFGSERGQLASVADQETWYATNESRRVKYCEPQIVRPTVDRLIEFGVVTEPSETYTVDWPSFEDAKDDQKADIAVKLTKALTDYAKTPGADEVVPIEIFLRTIMGFTDEEIEEIIELKKELEKEREAEDEEARKREEEMFADPALQPPVDPTNPNPPQQEEEVPVGV